MHKECITCNNQFFLYPEDLDFLKKYSYVLKDQEFIIPEPKNCPECRAKRRLAWRNERNYYKSKDIYGKPIISVFHNDSEVKSISYDDWWSNSYDPLKYGRDFDFNKTFNEQFRELLISVPQMAMLGSQNENCGYCNLIANCKNCYLLIESSNCEDCYYSYWLQKCTGCIDSSFSHECQYCYEIDNCYNCYSLKYSKNCNNCNNSYFLDNCISCSNCFGCINLVQKSFCIFNKQYTETEYQKMIQDLDFGSLNVIKKTNEKFSKYLEQFPKKYAQILKSENCTGNYIISSKDCFNCFHAHDAESCRYGEHVWRNSKFNMDVSTVGRDAELVYESINTGVSVYRIFFSIQCWTSSNIAYSYCCMNSKNSFGSVGLKNNEFCVFNKQYSENEYNILVSKIVEHMQRTGEWGEFFPIENSIYSYNESSAIEQFPLAKEQVLAENLKWKSKDQKDYLKQEFILSDNIKSVNEDIVSNILACKSCQKNYKIISQEYNYYKKYLIPVPEVCPDCRHLNRIKLRTNKVRKAKCSNCSLDITTGIKPEFNVLCEKCFENSL